MLHYKYTLIRCINKYILICCIDKYLLICCINNLYSPICCINTSWYVALTNMSWYVALTNTSWYIVLKSIPVCCISKYILICCTNYPQPVGKHRDVTVTAEWIFKANYVSIYLPFGNSPHELVNEVIISLACDALVSWPNVQWVIVKFLPHRKYTDTFTDKETL